jgi:phospholipid transport system substrate-binding protein
MSGAYMQLDAAQPRNAELVTSRRNGGPLFLLACVLALVLMGPLAARAAASSSPTEVVERLQAGLLHVMKNAKALGYEGRYKHLKPVVEDTHDLPGIARLAAGRHWDEFSSEQRKQYVQAFSDFSVATYAHMFDAYAGETFKTLAERKAPDGSAVVQSVLIVPGEEKRRFDYALRQVEGRWMIVNIIVDGVSDLAIRRSEYAGVLAKEGPDALISRLKERVAELTRTGK